MEATVKSKDGRDTVELVLFTNVSVCVDWWIGVEDGVEGKKERKGGEVDVTGEPTKGLTGPSGDGVLEACTGRETNLRKKDFIWAPSGTDGISDKRWATT